jgi:hypothetical protein
MIEIVDAFIYADLECTECGHQWQETFVSTNWVASAHDTECPECSEK